MNVINETLVPLISILTPILLLLLAFLGRKYIDSIDIRFINIDKRFKEQESILNELASIVNARDAMNTTQSTYMDRDLNELKETMKQLNNKMEKVLTLHLSCPARIDYGKSK